MDLVLDFWFDTLSPEDWWKKDPELDNLIKQQFSTLHEKACQGELFNWRNSAEGRLAEIIILDQFSRNIYRDKPKAFSADAQALVLAQEAVAGNFHYDLAPFARSFMFMPYMHSESLLIHEMAIDLFTQNGIDSYLEFEIQHKKIIEQFGRYPHRNVILSRESTDAELEFLNQENSSF